jgi:RNA polymerase sigma-70 factor (ECF subfamily)
MSDDPVKWDDTRPIENTAVEALSRRFRPALIGYFSRRVKDTAEAEDLAQEVFLRMLRRGNVADLDDVRAYLFETASSVLVDRARRGAVRHRGNHESFDPHAHAGETIPVERLIIGRESLNRASIALLELPERTRTIFVLRRLEGMRYADVAQRLGISVSAVEKHMVRAVAHLTERMRHE